MVPWYKAINWTNVDQNLYHNVLLGNRELTHWEWVTHKCVSKQALVQIMACHLVRAKPLSNQCGILVTGSLGTNCSEILIDIHAFPFPKIHLKMLAILFRPQCVNKIMWPNQPFWLTHHSISVLHLFIQDTINWNLTDGSHLSSIWSLNHCKVRLVVAYHLESSSTRSSPITMGTLFHNNKSYNWT